MYIDKLQSYIYLLDKYIINFKTLTFRLNEPGSTHFM